MLPSTTKCSEVRGGRVWACAPVGWTAPESSAAGEPEGFRTALHGCATRRADAWFELVDALLATERLVSLPHLPLEPVCRRGHGRLYTALRHGQLQAERLQEVLAALVRIRSDRNFYAARPSAHRRIVPGPLVRVHLARLPGRARAPKTLGPWWAGPAGIAPEPALVWRAYGRRFHIEHTIRFRRSGP
jgi:hypothetical protein